ncbi:MAG TPA: hypothetical protein VGE63_03365 [Candidatus Paceibacterota bacterium]
MADAKDPQNPIIEALTFAWKLIVFVILSILVVPAMAIMVTLHPTWEKTLKEYFHLGY